MKDPKRFSRRILLGLSSGLLVSALASARDFNDIDSIKCINPPPQIKEVLRYEKIRTLILETIARQHQPEPPKTKSPLEIKWDGYCANELTELERRDCVYFYEVSRKRVAEYNKRKLATLSRWENFLESSLREKASLPPIVFSQADDIANINKSQPWALYRFKNGPVYYFNFPDAVNMGSMLDRLRIFAELDHSHIQNDSEILETLEKIKFVSSDTVGMDYGGVDIADFFNLAKASRITLNPFEITLRERLIKENLLESTSGGLVAKTPFAIIATADLNAITEESGNAEWSKRLYRETLEHELNHGIYFTNKDYRAAVKQLWKEQTEHQTFIRKTLEMTADYNFDDEDLLIREFAAYFRSPKHLESDYLEKWVKAGSFNKSKYTIIEELGKRLLEIETKLGISR